MDPDEDGQPLPIARLDRRPDVERQAVFAERTHRPDVDRSVRILRLLDTRGRTRSRRARPSMAPLVAAGASGGCRPAPRHTGCPRNVRTPSVEMPDTRPLSVFTVSSAARSGSSAAARATAVAARKRAASSGGGGRRRRRERSLLVRVEEVEEPRKVRRDHVAVVATGHFDVLMHDAQLLQLRHHRA